MPIAAVLPFVQKKKIRLMNELLTNFIDTGMPLNLSLETKRDWYDRYQKYLINAYCECTVISETEIKKLLIKNPFDDKNDPSADI